MTPPRTTLVTLTHDRPVAFALCERWMARQSAGIERFHWLVVDDGTTKAAPSMGQTHVKRAPAPRGAESFLANLREAMGHVTTERVIFVEDDDWYHSNYLERASEWLERWDLVGEGNARYFNVRTRRTMFCWNGQHASLAQTAMGGSALSAFERFVSRASSTRVDMEFWRSFAGRKWIWPSSCYAVGIKGLPGSEGIGIGHTLGEEARHDPNLTTLKAWIGDDAEAYREFAWPIDRRR